MNFEELIHKLRTGDSTYQVIVRGECIGYNVITITEVHEDYIVVEDELNRWFIRNDTIDFILEHKMSLKDD